MIATYHNHSNWSDGKAALDEILLAAMRLGVDELGISDHFVLHPDGRQLSWSMPVSRLDAYVHAIDAMRASSESLGGPTIRLGLEVDWFPGRECAEAIRDALAPHRFDYLIGSVHDVDGFMVDSSPAPWQTLDDDQRNDVHRRYWQYVKAMAESGLFDIAAHLDLTKKFGYHPTIDLSDEIVAALDAIRDAGMVVEINTNGWYKPCKDAYPTLELLRECRRRGIETTISSDAHQPEQLVRDFAPAAERLREAGYDTVARFARRAVTHEPLEQAIPG